MITLFKNAAFATAIIASSASYAAAQSGPVDSKGQAGGTAHRMIEQGAVARGDYSAGGDEAMTSSEYRAAEMRRGSSDETRAVSEPRGYGSGARMSEEPSAETGGPQDRR